MKNSDEKSKQPHPIEITTAIQLLNSYFISMLEKKNYSVIKATQYTVEILLITGEKFSFWIASGKESFASYHHIGDNYFALHFDDSQKESLFNQLIEDVKVFEKSTPEMERRRAEYLKLKEEFEA